MTTRIRKCFSTSTYYVVCTRLPFWSRHPERTSNVILLRECFQCVFMSSFAFCVRLLCCRLAVRARSARPMSVLLRLILLPNFATHPSWCHRPERRLRSLSGRTWSALRAHVHSQLSTLPSSITRFPWFGTTFIYQGTYGVLKPRFTLGTCKIRCLRRSRPTTVARCLRRSSGSRAESKDDLSTFTQQFFQSKGTPLPFVVDPTGKLAQEVDADRNLGLKLGVFHTPTIVVVTRKGWIEVLDPSDLYSAIDQAQAMVANAPSRAPTSKAAARQKRPTSR